MNNSSLALNKENAISVALFIVAIGVVTLAPLLNQQIITGTIVNAVLFTATMILGMRAGIMIGIFPSVIALSTGLLPLVLAPMIPFIMLGNALLVFIFNLLKNRNYWLAVMVSSFFKFSFLSAGSWIVVRLIVEENVARNIIMMMSWPQLATALMGGLLSFSFLKFRNLKN